MRYSYVKGTDGRFIVTGAEDHPLYGLHGLTEEQAREAAFHLNTAFDRGESETQAAIKRALGIEPPPFPGVPQ